MVGGVSEPNPYLFQDTGQTVTARNFNGTGGMAGASEGVFAHGYVPRERRRGAAGARVLAPRRHFRSVQVPYSGNKFNIQEFVSLFVRRIWTRLYQGPACI